MSKKIAFFDFDGTITNKDSLFEFIRFAVGDKKFIFGLIVLSPILVLYKLKFIENYKAKQKMLSWFFKDMKTDIFLSISKEFSLNQIDKIVKKEAINKLYWHKKQKHKIVIVSASLESWLEPWCTKNGFELIATKLEFNLYVTGNLLSKNCYGIEKVNRIKEKFNLLDYDFIYAYGDSKGDKEMLELADKKYYKIFK